MIAMPDISRTCGSGGQCPVSKMNSFSVDGRGEGTVGYIGGMSRSTIRFYGWSADNQAAISNVVVDWGDGNTTEYHDVKQKNKKPFCGVKTECKEIPGLTCKSDSDCPASKGPCVEVGTCRKNQNIRCSADRDCQKPGTGSPEDSCDTRVMFGSSERDCEQGYFEYSHSYSCTDKVKAKLVDCATNGKSIQRCTDDNNREIDCQTGSLRSDLAPSGGCFDSANNACRFTPRVSIKDAWGWCTGDCRTKNSAGSLVDYIGDQSSKPSGYTNPMLHPNGGCYDGSSVKTNNSPKDSLNSNECKTSLEGKSQAWIVYPGAIQLGILQ